MSLGIKYCFLHLNVAAPCLFRIIPYFWTCTNRTVFRTWRLVICISRQCDGYVVPRSCLADSILRIVPGSKLCWGCLWCLSAIRQRLPSRPFYNRAVTWRRLLPQIYSGFFRAFTLLPNVFLFEFCNSVFHILLNFCIIVTVDKDMSY
jgi:hypothetical protein